MMRSGASCADGPSYSSSLHQTARTGELPVSGSLNEKIAARTSSRVRSKFDGGTTPFGSRPTRLTDTPKPLPDWYAIVRVQSITDGALTLRFANWPALVRAKARPAEDCSSDVFTFAPRIIDWNP